MNYYQIQSTGKGFITHEDNEKNHISGFPGDIWATENSSWASRVGAVVKTKAQAQAIVDLAVEESNQGVVENTQTVQQSPQLP